MQYLIADISIEN